MDEVDTKNNITKIDNIHNIKLIENDIFLRRMLYFVEKQIRFIISYKKIKLRRKNEESIVYSKGFII